MKKLIIFGADTLASLLAFQVKHQAGWELAGFTVDDNYLLESSFEGFPVIGFNGLEKNSIQIILN